MKFDLSKNFLKTTFGGNFLAILGLVFFILYLRPYILYREGSGGGAVAFSWILTSGFHLLLIALGFIFLIYEKASKSRLKNSFFYENKIYNIFFYFGIVFNALFLMLCGFIFFTSFIQP